MSDLTVNITTNPVTYNNGNNGFAQAHQMSGTGNAPWTYEWRKVNDDGSKTVIPDQPIGLCRSLGVGNYEYYLKDSSDPAQEFTIPFSIILHENIGFNVTLTRCSAFGKADGKIIGHIVGGVAPYRVELTVNGNPYRTIDNIPAATSDNPNNCDIEGLPPGAYSMWVYDSDTPQNKCGGSFTYFITSPPFATLNGTVDPLGLATTVSFEWGADITYGNSAPFGVVNGTGVHPVTLQLDSTSLLPGTTYHYRIKAVNIMGTVYGNDQTFLTSATLPIVVTLPATNIS